MRAGRKQGGGLLARVTTALRVPAPAIDRLPPADPPAVPAFSSSPIFPIVSGIERARDRRPDSVIDVRPALTYRRTAPVFANLDRLAPGDRARYEASLDTAPFVPRAAAAALGPASMFGAGYVKLTNGELLAESLSNVSANDTRHNLGLVLHKTDARWHGAPIQPRRTVTGPGTTLRDLGDRVWGHWLFELLPRIDILRHHPLFAQTSFVIAHSTFRSYYEALLACGVDPAKVVEVHDDVQMNFENYLCATPVLSNQNWIAPQNIAFIREVGQRAREAAGYTTAASRGRRLFITRGDAAYRKLLNQQAVGDLLAAEGFETLTIGDTSFARQVALFGEIEAAVVVLGSGASNLVFAPPGTPVVYLAPNCESPLFFLDLASIVGHRLSIVFGLGKLEALRPFADFTIEPDDLRAGLAALDLPTWRGVRAP